MTDTICELEKSLSYTFRDRSLAKRALTRKAYALENGIENDQEILRTLGDAVLKAILIDLLIVQGASSRSEITMKKSVLESSEGLSCIAKKYIWAVIFFLVQAKKRWVFAIDSMCCLNHSRHLSGHYTKTGDMNLQKIL